MSKKNQHIVPSDYQWGIKGEGNKKMTAIFDTQEEAINAGRDIAKNQRSELFIHNRKGQIRERDSYGNDSFPPKG